MAAAVHDRVDAEQNADRVAVLGIDSRSDDLEKTLPSAARTLALDVDESAWMRDVDRRAYLDETHELLPSGGTARQRPVGRYVVDNPEGLERTWRFLETAIEDFVDAVDVAPGDVSRPSLNVWVVNSLAGGTGGGAFPLIAGLLAEVLSELEAERNITTTLQGVGSLWRLDRAADRIREPDEPASYYVNAYTALAELQALVGEDSASVSLHPEAEQFVQNELDVGGALDRYLLVGLQEQTREHLSAVNGMVADAVYYLGAVPDPVDFPEHPNAHAARLFSLDGGALAFPTDAAERYVDLKEEREATRAELDHLERTRRAVDDDLRYLEAVLSLDRGELPATGAAVERELVRRCGDRASDIISAGIDPENLADYVETVVDDLQDDDLAPGRDRRFDSTAVVRYLFLGRLLTAAEREHDRARDRLADFATALVDTYREELGRHLDEEEIDRLEADPVAAISHLENFLAAERHRLVERREESVTILVDPFGHLESRIEELQEFTDELYAYRAEYDRYQHLRDEAQAAFRESRDGLTDRRYDLDEERHDLADQLAECERDLEAIQDRLETVATRLREATRDSHRTTVPVEDLERLDAETLERATAEGFTALVETELLEREAVERGIERVCHSLAEPIQDRPTSPAPLGVLAPVLADENADEWMDDVIQTATDAGLGLVETRVDTSDTLAIDLLALYAGIDLEGTSEFGVLHEYVTAPDRDLRDLLGADVDRDPEQAAAYPELR